MASDSMYFALKFLFKSLLSNLFRNIFQDSQTERHRDPGQCRRPGAVRMLLMTDISFFRKKNHPDIGNRRYRIRNSQILKFIPDVLS